MPWHRTGSVQVNQNSNVVAGTDTLFAQNVRVGDGFVGPDGRMYEVLNVPDDNTLSIYPAYEGISTNSTAYGVIPVQGYVKQAADRLNEIVRQYGDALAVLGDEEKLALIISLAESMTEAALDFTSQDTLAKQQTYLEIDRVDNTADVDKPVSTAGQQALDTKVDKVEGKGLSTNDFVNALKAKLEALPDSEGLVAALLLKVDKQEGYGLSQRDFTPTEKTKLGELPSVTGLNTQLATKVDKQEGYGLSKNDFNDQVKGKLDALPNQAALQSSFETKVDKVDGYGLSQNNFSNADKAKVDAIEASPFLGEYTTLAQLKAAHPTARPGDYANIDLGEESEVQRALWDTTDQDWFLASLGSGQMTPAQVKQAYEINADTNAYNDADKAKVGGIEAGAQVNYALISEAEAQSGASEIPRSWSALRVFQAIAAWWAGSQEKVKLDSIQEGAEVNHQAGSQGEAEGGGGELRTWSSARLFQAAAAWWAGSASKTKLDGIADGAQVNAAAATVAEAQEFTVTALRSWSPLRISQLVISWWAGSSAKTKLDGIDTGAQKNPDLVTQAAAEAATAEGISSWSALRVRQAIVGWWNGSSAKTKLDSIPTMPPSDGKSYVLKDGAWVESAGGSGANLLDVKFFHGYRSAIATECPGWVPIDGQILERAVWPAAWSKIATGTLYPLTATDGVWTATNAARRNFSPGNNTTNFRNMDWNGVTTGKAIFLRGSKTDSFSLKEDTMQGHRHAGGNDRWTGGQNTGGTATNGTPNSTTGDPISDGVNGAPRIGTETAPAHAEGVWLICMANAPADPGTVDVNALATEVATLKARNGALIKETYYRVPGAISHTFAINAATYEVEVWSGGQGGGNNAPASGASSFGDIQVSGASATGSLTGFGGTPGVGSGGLLNLMGTVAGGTDANGWYPTGAAAPRGGGGGQRSTTSGAGVITHGGQPGGGGGATAGGQNGGSSGGYSFDRKAVVGGSTITGIVGAGGSAGVSGTKGGDGMIIVREYASSGPSLDTISTILDQIKPVVISGIVGFIGTPGVAGPNAKIPFSTSFWSNKGGITYDSTNRRFYLPSAGTYRVQLSGLNTATTGNRILVGLNTDLPTIANHKGVAYTNLSNQDLGLESTFDVPDGSYICFLLLAGSLNNAADNILGQFSIEKVAS